MATKTHFIRSIERNLIDRTLFVDREKKIIIFLCLFSVIFSNSHFVQMLDTFTVNIYSFFYRMPKEYVDLNDFTTFYLSTDWIKVVFLFSSKQLVDAKLFTRLNSCERIKHLIEHSGFNGVHRTRIYEQQQKNTTKATTDTKQIVLKITSAHSIYYYTYPFQYK